jgi:O-succinylbenzoic acid--CoA ligase
MASPIAGLTLSAGDLVAVDLPPSPRWPGLLAEIWDAEAAIMPLDVRLPAAARAQLVASARPTVLVDAQGATRRDGGMPVDAGTAAVVATSGTTGDARLAELSRDALTAAVTGSTAALGALPGDRWLLCLPAAHIGGLLVLFRGLLGGTPALVLERFSVDALAVERDVHYTSLVPTMVRRLVDAGADVGHLRAVLVGGDALPAALRAEAAAAGLHVVHTYGQTQSCGGVVYDGTAMPGVTVRIADEGEVQLHGRTLMRGYRLDDAATARAFTDDGWLRTGDGGTIDGDGRLQVRGRIGDVIVSGGEKVWPADVEQVLAQHPAIADVAVTGEPDREWGQRVVALVVPAGGVTPALDDVRAWARDRLAAYQLPRALVVVDALPRTASGKLRRAELRSALD